VYQLTHWWVEHNWSRAAINQLFRNPTTATVSNFALFYTLLTRLHKLFYKMGINSLNWGNVCFNHFANLNTLHNDDYTSFFLCRPVECIEFLIHQPAFREHMSYTPEMEFIEAEESIYSEVKSSDWWWNEQVRWLIFAIAIMILTPSIATVATWSIDCPCSHQFRPDTYYNLFR